MTKKAEYSGCRAKTEHLNLQKRYIKYPYSECTLDGIFKTLILSPEVTKFIAWKVVSYGVNRFWGNRVKVDLPISLKRLNKKKTPFVPLLALLEIRNILKNEHNRCTLEEIIAKNMYPANWPKRRGDLTSELNLTT